MRIFASFPERLRKRAADAARAFEEIGNELLYPESGEDRFRLILSSDAVVVFHDGKPDPVSDEDEKFAKEQELRIAYSKV